MHLEIFRISHVTPMPSTDRGIPRDKVDTVTPSQPKTQSKAILYKTSGNTDQIQYARTRVQNAMQTLNSKATMHENRLLSSI